MRLTILIYSFFWVLATGLQTQDHASLTGTITDLGKPVSDATITLKGYKDENCAKLANKEDRVAQEEKGLAACESESGQVTTDDKGGYSFPDLKPGWYNMRLLFTITAPPAPVYAPVYDSMMCPSVEWGVVFLSPKEAMGKYNGFAQSVFFNLKKKQARRIDFNYEKKTGENPECFAQGSLVPDSGRLAKTESLVLSMPGTKSSLSLMPGPSAWEIDFHPKDALVFLDAKGRADHLLITAFLKKVPFEATAESCRESFWHDSEKKLQHLQGAKWDTPQLSLHDGVALLEFTLLEFRGEKVLSRDVHAYQGRGHVCSEVHLSKEQFQPADRKLFDEVLATVKFVSD